MKRSGTWTEKEKEVTFSDQLKEISDIYKITNKVSRKKINSAIYVEKPLSAVSSETGFLSRRTSCDDLEVKIKRCTCSTNPKTCPFHWKNNLSATICVSTEQRVNLPNPIGSAKIPENKTKVSQCPKLLNTRFSTDEIKKHVLKKWIAKKEEEKKKKEPKEKVVMDAKISDKEMLLEQERNNFKTWLLNKKKLEMESKKKKEKELEEQQLKDLEKEKRQLEAQLNFQLWLKKKEEALLEKKIKHQLELIGELERREQHLRDNEKAFSDWLKNSKNRQKPAPLNKGIESLCSSRSITYVNPNPWNPIS